MNTDSPYLEAADSEPPVPSGALREILNADVLLDYLRSKQRRPERIEAIIEGLGLAESQRAALDVLVERLAGDGLVVRVRGDRIGVPEKMNLVVGRLTAHPDGYGFVQRKAGAKGRDLFIPGSNIGAAIHGDVVVARIEHLRRGGRPVGRVIRVLERARQTIVGRYEKGTGGFPYVVPFDRRIASDICIPRGAAGGAKDGQIVNVQITRYADSKRGPEGHVIEVLGKADDPRIDIEIIIREFGLEPEFPEEVTAAVAPAADEVTEAEVEGRTDFRELQVVTIDGENAQDFDDAINVERLPNGNYRLAVHIADVAYYVGQGSILDDEARRRATSVYFPDRVLPMLPERLSNGICSLRPGEDRLVQSVLIEIDRTGKTVNYEFHDGVIRSVARLSYKAVAQLLNGENIAEEVAAHGEHLRRMEMLCRILTAFRRRLGSIDFDLPEPEILIDLRGEIEAIHRRERNVAHRIIEEFMIRANEVVASHLLWEDVPSLFRVHDGPDTAKVDYFREFVEGLGHRLEGHESPQPCHFAKLLGQVEGTPVERVISMLMLRTMKQARYQPNNIAHFGLASERYTHFTSPIRRYPDLVVHRLLKHDRGSTHQPKFDLEETVRQLNEIGLVSSRLERRAEEAERDYVEWKKVRFMADRVGEVYDGYVTGVQSFGLFVELAPHFVEGLVHVSGLDDDYYRFDERKQQLMGTHGKRMFTLGDRLRVRVAKVDQERRRIDLALEEGPAERPSRPARRRRRGSSRRGSKPKRIGDSDATSASPSDRTSSVLSSEEKGTSRRGSRRSRRGGRRAKARRNAAPQMEPTPEVSEGAPAEVAPEKRSLRSRKKAVEPSASQRGRDKRGAAGATKVEEAIGEERKKSHHRRARDRSRADKQSKAAVEESKPPTRRTRGGGQGGDTKAKRGADAEPKARAEAKAKDETKDKPRKVNPYLTDVDF